MTTVFSWFGASKSFLSHNRVAVQVRPSNGAWPIGANGFDFSDGLVLGSVSVVATVVAALLAVLVLVEVVVSIVFRDLERHQVPDMIAKWCG